MCEPLCGYNFVSSRLLFDPRPGSLPICQRAPTSTDALFPTHRMNMKSNAFDVLRRGQAAEGCERSA